MDDKRSIDVYAGSIEDLKNALSAVPSWDVVAGSTPDFEIGLKRGDDFINFKVKETSYGVEAHSVNIMPQDTAQAPDLAKDEIYKVYQVLSSLPEDQGIGVRMNVSEQDVDKLAKL
ncbi:hypothetical protein [Klebsiella oxytoca]|uniref:hypothetical protein n=1 Tax=Klebsiella oxytoca TaxID=571 RepID=UPI000665FA20|nr:hypothetical protein [Klebsiella oxytoca]